MKVSWRDCLVCKYICGFSSALFFVCQEMKMIDDLLYAMVGIDGNYVRLQKGQAHDGNSFLFCIEPTMNRSVHVRTFPWPQMKSRLCCRVRSCLNSTERETGFLRAFNPGVQDLAKRMIPLCENYMVVSQFAEARSHFRHGLTNHAFAAGLRAILQVGTQFVLLLFSAKMFYYTKEVIVSSIVY